MVSVEVANIPQRKVIRASGVEQRCGFPGSGYDTALPRSVFLDGIPPTRGGISGVRPGLQTFVLSPGQTIPFLGLMFVEGILLGVLIAIVRLPEPIVLFNEIGIKSLCHWSWGRRGR